MEPHPGKSGREISLNCPGFQGGGPIKKERVLVDGLQGLTAFRKFLANKLGVFGGYKILDFEDKTHPMFADLVFCVNGLNNRKEVLQWYLYINSGGTPYTESEITKIKDLLSKEVKYETS